MTTVRDLVSSAYRKIGVFDQAEALQASEAQSGLEALQYMVDAWALETLLVPIVSLVSKQLVVGQTQYTIGKYPDPVPVPLPDNHIETAKPMSFLGSWIRDAAGTDYVLEEMGPFVYANISVKTNGSRPSRFFFRESWPLSFIYFESEPYAQDTVYFQVRQTLDAILPLASIDDVINVPPGYKKAIVYNLAVELASEYGQALRNEVVVIASQTLRKIKQRNWTPLFNRVDRTLVVQQSGRGTYDINQGP